MYKNLVRKIKKFFIQAERVRMYGPSKQMKELQFRTGADFKYLNTLYTSLRRMLRDGIHSEDK
jgi:hypothetical protein